MKKYTAKKLLSLNSAIKLISLIIVITLCTATVLTGCVASDGYKVNSDLSSAKDVTINFVGGKTDFKAMEDIISDFTELYPNCTINYEYIQDYETSLLTRLKDDPTSVDIFLSNNITTDSDFQPYAIDYNEYKDNVDLSNTYDGLLKNFSHKDSEDITRTYSVPIGGEIRGMFVNKTLLNSLNIDVPKTKDEFLSACKTLKEAGYIPVQGNPGLYATEFMFPYVANVIKNTNKNSEEYKLLENCKDEAAELFEEPLKLLYSVSENYYYQYKYVETEYGKFLDFSDETYIRNFLDVDEDGKKDEVKENDVAFMPNLMSLSTKMDKAIDDYHSDMEYEFILSPLSDDGGFAYLSPCTGISVNSQSENTAWALEFINYFFSKDVNKKFAEEYSVLPNTSDVENEVKTQFDIPEKNIATVSDINFDYIIYNVLEMPMIEIAKCNNPKYMNVDKDGKETLYDFDYYMDRLKANFTEMRETGEIVSE